MKTIIQNMRAKSQSNKAEPMSVATILLIAFAVVIVMTVGFIIYSTLEAEAEVLAKCLSGITKTATSGPSADVKC